MQSDGVAEVPASYDGAVDYEHEHRFAEHDCFRPEHGLWPLPIFSEIVSVPEAGTIGLN